MAVSEQRRHQLYNRLEEVLGQDEAAALIEYFPPTGWNDVVRTRDLDAAVATLRSESAALRAEMHELIGDVRGEIGGVRGEIAGVRGEIAGVRAEMHELIGDVRREIGELRGEMHELTGSMRAEIRTQTRSLFLSLVGLQITGAGVAIAVARII